MVGGYLSLLYSVGDKPLEYWSKRQSQSGRIRKILDSDLLENVIEIQDFEQPNGHGTSIICPPDASQVLNVELPILVLVLKNLSLNCRLQLQVADTQNCIHHFQLTNGEFEKHAACKDVICRVKLKLEQGWNKLELNLSSLTEAAFKRQYWAAQRLEICGNCRLRRIYFIDKHYENEEVSPKLYDEFLDSYMLKWGIHSVERATQTAKKGKGKIKENDSEQGRKNAKQPSSHSLSDDETGPGHAKDLGAQTTRKVEENFLRCLQTKAEGLIDNFFERRRAKAPCASELKQRARIKPYALPACEEKTFASNVVSEDALRKINILRNFTDSCLASEEKRKEEKTVQSVEEDWKNRYFPRQESLVHGNYKNGFSHLHKSILEREPRSSSLFPSEVKLCSAGNKRLLGTVKKYAETIKENQNEGIVN